MNEKLKQYLIDNHGLPQDADDSAAKSLLGELVATGKVDMDKVKAIQEEKSEVEQRVQGMIDSSIAKHLNSFKDELKGLLTPAPQAAPVTPPTPEGDVSATAKAAMVDAAGDAGSADDEPAPRIRLKKVIEQFDHSPTAATYDKSQNEFMRKHFAGRRVSIGEGIGMPGRTLDMPTERTKAIAGAWFKHLINRAYRERGMTPRPQFKMTEMDRQLVEYAVHECKFVGPVNFDSNSDDSHEWYKCSVPTEMQRKALLDDSTSGGLEAVPIEFDDAVIITPLLEGELFPLVTIRNVTRRRIEGFSIGNPTIAWAVAEGSAIALFTTTSFVAAFDTTIYPVAGAMEVGLDFLADSPTDIGAVIIDRYGAVFRKEMDDVIANGVDASSQPTGLFQTSGLGSVSSANGSTGPWTIADIEGLIAGVAKQYRQEAGRERGIFLTNDTTYWRWRGIYVGSTDQRRVLGMDHESYMTLGHPHKVNGDVGNAYAGFFCLNRYRFYRRAGFTVRVVTEDQDLAKKNMEMIVVRARVGGQLELGGAGASCTDGQS